jgi:predicted dehydrogenase
MTRFALVGSGWRAGFFVRIAEELPEHFTLSGIVTRREERARALTHEWHAPAYPSIADLLAADRPDFVILSVPSSVAVGQLSELAQAGMPALSETPPAPDVDGLRHLASLVDAGARIQVAEQYPYQPLHAARLALTDSGAIGRVSMASISFSHGYHAFSVMRRHLGVRGEPATIRASVVRGPVETGFTRAGARTSAETGEETRTVALVNVAGKLGLYDFGDNQHRSYVRHARIDVRGAKGEISEDKLQVVHGVDEVVTISLRREMGGADGDLSGHYLKGISGADGWLWRNRYPEARLADDELAIAECMHLMAGHAAGGPGFYGIPDAAQDHYLYLALQQAAASGETVTTEVQPWADGIRPAGAGTQ